MVEDNRFLDTMIVLYWENLPVGYIEIAITSVLRLPGSEAINQGSLLNDGGQWNLTRNHQNVTEALPDGALDLPPQTNVTSNTTNQDPSGELIRLWSEITSNSSAPLAFPEETSLTVPRLTVTFDEITRASKLDRNDVFLTTFAGLLHAAQFPPDQDIESFTSLSPTDKIFLHMYSTGNKHMAEYRCQVSHPMTF